VDHQNLWFSWCAITALGSFDYKKGGHLILWDLKLVIQFPPGSTTLIPSSVLQHSNVAIQDGETRYSVTQFSAGGLFRWRDNGFKSVRDHLGGMEKEQQAAALEELSEQFAFGLSQFSTLDEVKASFSA
jgi:hypothetical protein